MVINQESIINSPTWKHGFLSNMDWVLHCLQHTGILEEEDGEFFFFAQPWKYARAKRSKKIVQTVMECSLQIMNATCKGYEGNNWITDEQACISDIPVYLPKESKFILDLHIFYLLECQSKMICYKSKVINNSWKYSNQKELKSYIIAWIESLQYLQVKILGMVLAHF